MDSLSLSQRQLDKQMDREASRQAIQQTDCTAANQPDTQASKQTGRPAGTSSQTDKGQQKDRPAGKQRPADRQTSKQTERPANRQTGQADTHSSMFRVDTSQGITQRHTGGCGESGWAHSIPSHQAMLQHRHCTHAALQMMKTHFTQPMQFFVETHFIKHLFCHRSFRPGFRGANLCQGKQTTI